MMTEILINDSITRLTPDAAGAVAYCASHGGLYCGVLARSIGLRGVILSDAGVGRGQAGIAALSFLQDHGVAAATISHRSARIGDGQDGYARGLISCLNPLARAAGVREGMACRDALAHLHANAGAVRPDVGLNLEEHRSEHLISTDTRVVIADSVSLVRPEDAGRVVICGSHGGLLGGDPRTAVSADVHAIVYNDADRGVDDAGVSRLPALDERDIAGACVSAWTAQIGDGLATYEAGVISAINRTAAKAGAVLGMSAREFAQLFADRATR